MTDRQADGLPGSDEELPTYWASLGLPGVIDLPVVIAHLGGPDFQAFFDLADRYPALRLDTTTVFAEFGNRIWPFPAHLVPRLRDLGDRILYGSDFPAIPYPYAEHIAAIAGLGLGADWLRAVFHHNAATLWPDLMPSI